MRTEPFIRDGIVNFYCDWSELRELTTKAMNGEKVFDREKYHAAFLHFLPYRDNRASWLGVTHDQMMEWLRKGYRANELRNVGFSPPIRDKRKLVFDEEGDEFHYDLAQSGDDKPFSYFTKTESMPGVELEIVTSFSSMVDSKVVVEFGNWIARAVISLESAGIDCGVSIGSQSPYFLTSGEGANKPIRIMTRVKTEGKTSDFTSWSPMISPAVFRTFCHCMGIVLAERYGCNWNSGMYTRDEANLSWNVSFDPSRRVVTIANSFSSNHFPELEMTDKLRAVLREMSKNY